MSLDEVPPKDAHHLLMRIYEYIQKEKSIPTTDSIKYSTEILEGDFRNAIYWLASQGLIHEESCLGSNRTTVYPTIPRYKYFMDLLTILEMDFLFKSPLIKVLWERDSPVC